MLVLDKGSKYCAAYYTPTAEIVCRGRGHQCTVYKVSKNYFVQGKLNHPFSSWLHKSKACWWHQDKWSLVICRFIQEEWGRNVSRKERATQSEYLFIKLPERNDTGGNKLTRQVNKRLMHSNTIKIVLILLQTKHATNALYPIKIRRRKCFFVNPGNISRIFWKRNGYRVVFPFASV